MSDSQDIVVTITDANPIEVTITDTTLWLNVEVTSPQDVNIIITDEAQPIEVTVPETETLEVVLEEAFYIERLERIYTTRIDESTSELIYIGKATVGSLENNAVWKIERIDYLNSVMRTMLADGDAEFNNVWSNRGLLSYA